MSRLITAGGDKLLVLNSVRGPHVHRWERRLNVICNSTKEKPGSLGLRQHHKAVLSASRRNGRHRSVLFSFDSVLVFHGATFDVVPSAAFAYFWSIAAAINRQFPGRNPFHLPYHACRCPLPLIILSPFTQAKGGERPTGHDLRPRCRPHQQLRRHRRPGKARVLTASLSLLLFIT